MGNNKINLSIVHMIPLLRNRGKIANCSYIAIVGSFVFLFPTNKTLMDIIELAEQNQQNAWKLLDETGYYSWLGNVSGLPYIWSVRSSQVC